MERPAKIYVCRDPATGMYKKCTRPKPKPKPKKKK
jgi:hypothetical protein